MSHPGFLFEKTVLVTGAGRGIGRGVARAAAEEGAWVIATDLDTEAATATALLVTNLGGSALAFAMNVTSETSVAEVVERVLERFGRLDGWVNNAGVLHMTAALDSDGSDWGPQFEVNARALYSCCRQAAGAMKTRGGGAIVNIASNAGKVGYPNMAAYNASKAAVISLTRSLAAEWAEHRINVNAVCPGGVDTPMLDEVAHWVGESAGLDEVALKGEMLPAQLGRHVRPIEVGRVVTFLLSERAEIIRGQAINVDGGDTPY
ncbi:MAG: SDR family oxidoreductase [Acidobacteriota bacterium]|nr:SDR family oxidoreductase [Acidobacteriota bacterium]